MDYPAAPTEVAGLALLSSLRQAHAALDAAAEFDAAGKQSGWVPASGLGARELEQVVRLAAELEGRTSALRMHALTEADRVRAADTTGAADTAAWATAAAGKNRNRTWGAIWLGDLLESKYHATRAALASGRITEDHAAIIVRVAESVPDSVTPEELAHCERVLVGKAEYLPPTRLRRAAKRLLEPLSKRAADEHEGKLLDEEEQKAEAETWFYLSDNGNGTYTGKFVIPELHALVLRHVIDRLSAPRRLNRGADGGQVVDETAPTGLNVYERLGRSLCELIEHLPTDGLGPSSFNVVVHIDEQHLRDRVGAAQLDTGTRISAGQVRRLACGAGILPMVLDGRSTPLDLGRMKRVFSPGQATALSASHDSCAAEGCERPFAWCELHHLRPWGEGGPTDLANAVPLCGHHHRRIHDRLYEHTRLPDGQIRFQHRWPSRRRRDEQSQRRAA